MQNCSLSLLKTALVGLTLAVLVTLAMRPRRALNTYAAVHPQIHSGYQAQPPPQPPQQQYGGQQPPIIVNVPPSYHGPQYQQPAPNTNAQTTQDCFPSDALVLTPQGHRRMMDIVNISNTEVLVADEKNNLFFSPILLWIHKSKDYAKYVDITTETGERILASKTHFVFRVPCNGGEKEALFAQDVGEKDCVLVLKGEKLVPQRVTGVTQSQKHGRYQFLTETGTVLVNNVLASTYSVIDDYKFQHQIFKGYYHVHQFVDKFMPHLAQMLDNDKKNYIVKKMMHLLESGTVF